MDMDKLVWSCNVCNIERPNSRIDVFKRDISIDYNLPYGTMQQNVRHCNDKLDCIEKAKTLSFLK